MIRAVVVCAEFVRHPPTASRDGGVKEPARTASRSPTPEPVHGAGEGAADAPMATDCGGPGNCTKMFCFSCSAAEVSDMGGSELGDDVDDATGDGAGGNTATAATADTADTATAIHHDSVTEVVQVHGAHQIFEGVKAEACATADFRCRGGVGVAVAAADDAGSSADGSPELHSRQHALGETGTGAPTAAAEADESRLPEVHMLSDASDASDAGDAGGGSVSPELHYAQPEGSAS